ncbi:hypothetical protein [Fibrobacter sp.]|uniref:hypothetical protein n=1 Tax=Fibrobacter sp. TaxID=35828 RepID=UPI0026290073|nr:hypothetical protein [Fibrobacter sp.]MDD5942523.1 hypothetical protein [Fibrobacter sp.]
MLTVYTPIRNSSGRTVAYAAADISMDEVSSDEAMFFIKMLSLFFGLSIIIMSVVIELVNRGIVIPVNRMAFAAMKFSGTTMIASTMDTEKVNLEKIRNAADRVVDLKITSFDEIGNLYDSLSSMASDTYNFIARVQ